MHNKASYLLRICLSTQILYFPLFGGTNETPTETKESISNPEVPQTQKYFTAFTGRTLKNKVRIRLQPNLDAPILREINKGDLFIVVGETNDFYAIETPDDVKGYVFRTYVLDNVIEGNRVNVRLEPNIEAPIIAQLQSGEKINGQISALNSKWLEITPPDSTRFFIAKEYVENIGDSNVKATLMLKKEEGLKLLNNMQTLSQAEMSKPWNQINLDSIYENLNKMISDYSDFPEIQSKSKELLTMLQESYFQKKMDYLESLSKNADLIKAHNNELVNKVAAQEAQINELQQSNMEEAPSSSSSSTTTDSLNPADKMNFWIPVENQIYETWAETHENQPISAFYDEQFQKSSTLKGIIQHYNRSVRNKPGDYVLLNPTTRIPVAYLYSTQINLHDYANKPVTIRVAPRNNNNFAYPAYFVLSVE